MFRWFSLSCPQKNELPRGNEDPDRIRRSRYQARPQRNELPGGNEDALGLMVSAVIVPQRKELPRGIEDAVSGVTGEKSRPTRTKHPETDSKILDHKAIGKETNRMPEDQFKRQLIAFLHDPPCKFSDIRFHESASETLLRNAVDNWDEESRRPDWVASAGDRLCLPKLRYIKPEEFSHPFSGEKKTISALGELERETGEAQRRVLTETPSTSQEKLFLMWRFWKNELARVRKDSGLWPADTRLPNHTIWNHMGITAALSRCEGTEEHRPIQASLLTVQFGPVQDWIEAARSTKDCWAGSHILSRISAAAMKSLADTYGPTAILSPDLRGQPLYDLAEFELINKFGRWRETEAGGDPSLLRIASIPHKFTALIPSAGAEEAAQKAVEAAQGFWEKTAEKAWSLWESQGLSRGWKKEWDEQIGNWLQYAWQVTEIPKADSRGDISPYVETWKKTTGNSGESVEAEIAFALAIPDANADTRNYRSVRQGMGWGLLKKEGKKVVTYTTGHGKPSPTSTHEIWRQDAKPEISERTRPKAKRAETNWMGKTRLSTERGRSRSGKPVGGWKRTTSTTGPPT